MTWALKAPIPGSGTNAVREHGAAGIGSKIYVTGGFLPNVFGGPVGDLTWLYDTATDTWTALAAMPAVRATHGCAAIGSKVYVAGGQDNSAVVHNNLYEYNPATDTWATKATMPSTRFGAAAVAIGTKLYVIGGKDNGGTVRDTLYEWNQGTNSWTTKAAMPAAVYVAAAVAIGTDIYVFGGADASEVVVDTVYKWDQGTNTWSTLGTMPVADAMFGMAVVRGSLVYVIGGRASGIDDPVGGNLDKSTLWSYDPGTDTWTDTGDPLPEFRWIVTNAATSTHLWVISGWSGSSTSPSLYRWSVGSGGGTGPTGGGKVWAIRGDADAEGDLNWAADGSSTSGLIFPPDTDSWDATDVGVTPAWHAGGSDGRFHYHLAIDSGGQWWVAKFDASMGSLLDRWEVTGWVSNNRDTGSGADTWEPELPTQHVTANASNVVVIGHRWDYDAGYGDYRPAAIETTVFDLTGTILDQWSYPTPDDGSDAYETINQLSGTCLDTTSLYFVLSNINSDDVIAQINLATGVLTQLFAVNFSYDSSLAVVDDQIIAVDPSWAYPQGLRAGRGIVEIGGDLILAGFNGIARIQQDGTPVWWAATDGTEHFAGLAHSGNGSVWAGLDTADAVEYQYDGTYVQRITLIEFARQAWLGPAPARGGWRFGISF